MSKSAAMVLLYVKWLLEVGAIVSSYSYLGIDFSSN